MVTSEEELGHLRETLKRQQEKLLKYKRFVDWLVPPLIKDDPLTRQALSLKDRPVHDVQKKYEALPEVNK